MNKLFYFFNFLILTIIILFSLNYNYGWDDCPYGYTNSSCVFPGKCNKYIDTNNNKICDHSEPTPSTEKNTNLEIVETNTNNNENISSNENIIDKYVPTPSSELKNYTIKEICDLYNISENCLIEKLKLKINETNNEENNNYKDNNIQLTNEIIEEYINISGSKLKSYTIKEICNIYNIETKDLKEMLGVPNVPDDTLFETLKKEYGISPLVVKKSIVECLINNGKITLNYEKFNKSNEELKLRRKTLINNINENTKLEEIKEVYSLSSTDLKEAIYNCIIEENKIKNNTNKDNNINNNSNKSIFDTIIQILFGEINLKELFSNIFK